MLVSESRDRLLTCPIMAVWCGLGVCGVVVLMMLTTLSHVEANVSSWFTLDVASDIDPRTQSVIAKASRDLLRDGSFIIIANFAMFSDLNSEHTSGCSLSRAITWYRWMWLKLLP